MRGLLSVLVISLLIVDAMASTQGTAWSGGAVVDKYGSLTSHANMLCQLLPDSFASLIANSLITSWPDSSAATAACSFSVDNAANLPYLKKQLLNSYDVLRFDSSIMPALKNSGTLFQSSLHSTNPLTNNVNDMTVFIVARVKNWDSSTSSLITLRDAANGHSFQLILRAKPSDPSLFSAEIGYYNNGAAYVAAATDYVLPTSRFHIFAIKVDNSGVPSSAVYVDGSINTRTLVNTDFNNPISVVGTEGFYIGRGYKDATGGLFDGDIAEVLVYNAAFSVAEIDRVGYHLARKFDLPWVWTPSSATQYRSRTGMNGVSIYPSEGPVVGSMITITGDRLIPYDTNADGVGTVGDLLSANDVKRLQAVLMVTIGIRLPVCPIGVPASRTTCAAASQVPQFIEKECINPQIWQIDSPTADGTYSGTSGSIQCFLPEGAATEFKTEVLIKWSGIPYMASGFKYSEPTVSAIIPSQVSYAGGDTITIIGSNFGAGATWISNTQDWATIVEVNPGGSTRRACSVTTYISSNEVLCVVPMLPAALYSNVGTTGAVVPTSINVRIANFRSHSSSVVFNYGNVPAYYGCYSTSKSTCLSCCPGKCVTNVFVQSDYQACISACTTFCTASVTQDCSSIPTPAGCAASAVPVPTAVNILTASAASASSASTTTTSVATSSSSNAVVGTVSAVTPTTALVGVLTVFTLTGSSLNNGDYVKIIDGSVYSCGGEDKNFGVVGGSYATNLMISNNGGMATFNFTFTQGAASGFLCYYSVNGDGFTRAVSSTVIKISDGKPKFKGPYPTMVPTSSSSSVTITGSDFGNYDRTVKVRVGGTNCEASRWVSDQSVTCRLPLGVGVADISVTAGVGVLGTVVGLLKYKTATISSAVITNLPVSGSFSVTLLGGNFGKTSPSATAKVGLTSCGGTVWISDSAIAFRTSHGASGATAAQVNVANNVAISRPWLSFNAPAVSSALGANLPTTGARSVTLVGNAGYHISRTTAIGSTAVESTMWLSHSSVMLKCARGLGDNMVVGATINGVLSTDTKAFSYDNDGARLIWQSRSNHPTTGSSSVTVIGSSMGSSVQSVALKIGRTAVQSTTWWSATYVVTKSPFGPGDSLEVYLTLNKVVKGTLTWAVTYDIAVLSSFARTNFAATAGQSVTLLGKNAARNGLSARPRIGSTGTENSPWVSDSAIVSKIPSSAFVRNTPIGITVHKDKQTLSTSYSHDISRVTSAASVNAPISGAMSLTLMGNNFGTKIPSTKDRLGYTSPEAFGWTSDSAVVAKGIKAYGGGFTGLRIAVSIGPATSDTLTNVFSFNAPQPNGMIQAATQPSTGAAVVSVYGASMGEREWSDAVRPGGTACEYSRWMSSSTLFCKLARGKGNGLLVAVSGGSQKGTAWQTFSYASPWVSSVLQTTVPSTGAVSVTVLASGYSSPGSSPKARIGRTGTSYTNWYSDSSVASKSTAWEIERTTSPRSLIMTIRNQKGTLVASVVFGSMTPASATVNTPSTGTTSVTLLGTNYGTMGSYKVRLGSSAVAATNWMSSTAVNGKIPLGYVSSPSPVASVGIKNTMAVMLSYNRAMMSSLIRGNAPATGQVSMTIIAVGTSANSFSTTTRIGGTAPTATAWTSQSCLTSRLSTGGSVSARTVAVTQSKVTTSMTNAVTFDGIWLGTLVGYACVGSSCYSGSLSVNGASTGAISVSIMGVNVGQNAAVAARHGSTASPSARWQSFSTMVVKTPQGQGDAVKIAVTANSNLWKSTVSNTFTFDTASITAITPATAVGTGAVSITILTRGMAYYGFSAKHRFGGTGSQSTMWVAESTVLAKIPQGGATLDLAFVLTQGQHHSANTKSKVFFYSPQTSSIARTNVAKTGSISVTLLGNSMSRSDKSHKLRIGGSAVQSTNWVSDSALRVKHQAVESSNRRVVLTAGQDQAFYTNRNKNTVNFAISFDKAQVSNTLRTNVPVSGSFSITVIGTAVAQTTYFTSKARLGSTNAEASAWASSSCMSCKWPRATNAVSNMIAATSTATERGTLVMMVTTDTAKLPLAGISAVNQAATGSISLTLVGWHYSNMTPKSRLASTASPSFLWVSDTSSRLKIGTGTYSVSGHVVITMGGIDSSTASFSYNYPVVSSIKSGNGPTSGGVSMTLFGSNFGDASKGETIYIGTSLCTTSTWVSSSSMVCVTPSTSGVSQTVFVQNTAAPPTPLKFTQAYTYDVATVSNMIRTNVPTTGAVSLTLLGTNVVNNVLAVLIDGDFPQATMGTTTWVSFSALTCLPSPGLRFGTAHLTPQVNARNGVSFTSAYTIDTPCASSTINQNSPATAMSSVTIIGSNAGIGASSLKARLSRTAMEATVWWSESMVVSKAPAGAAGSVCRSVVSSIRGYYRSRSLAYTYDGAAFSNVVQVNVPATGGISFTLVAKNFGAPASSSASSRVGFTTTTASRWVSDSALRGKTSAGTGIGRRIAATVGTSTCQTGTWVFSFNAGLASAINRGANMPKTGAALVTVLGNSAGILTNPSLRTVLGHTAAEYANWVSDSAINVKAPSGDVPVRSTVIVTTDRNPASQWNLHSYNAAWFSSAIRTNTAPGTGAVSVTILGSGARNVSPRLRIGTSAMDYTMWSSSSAIISKISHAHGQYTMGVVLTVKMQKGTTMYPVCYDAPLPNALTPTPPKPWAVHRTGANSVTIVATGFGKSNLSPCLRVHNTGDGWSAGYQAHMWVADTQIVSKAAANSKAGRSAIAASVRRSVGTRANLIEYLDPSPSSVSRMNSPPTGAVTATLYGQRLGSGETEKIRIGVTAAEATDWVAWSQIKAKVPVLHLDTNVITVTTGYIKGTTQSTFATWPISADVPAASSAARTNGPMAGGTSLTVLGSNYGIADETQRIYLGKYGSIAGTTWVSNTAILGKTGSSASAAVTSNIAITARTRVRGTITVAFTYT